MAGQEIESCKAAGGLSAEGFSELKRPNWGEILACGFISVILHWWKECSKAVYKHWSWIEMTESVCIN